MLLSLFKCKIYNYYRTIRDRIAQPNNSPIKTVVCCLYCFYFQLLGVYDKLSHMTNNSVNNYKPSGKGSSTTDSLSFSVSSFIIVLVKKDPWFWVAILVRFTSGVEVLELRADGREG